MLSVGPDVWRPIRHPYACQWVCQAAQAGGGVLSCLAAAKPRASCRGVGFASFLPWPYIGHGAGIAFAGRLYLCGVVFNGCAIAVLSTCCGLVTVSHLFTGVGCAAKYLCCLQNTSAAADSTWCPNGPHQCKGAGWLGRSKCSSAKHLVCCCQGCCCTGTGQCCILLATRPAMLPQQNQKLHVFVAFVYNCK